MVDCLSCDVDWVLQCEPGLVLVMEPINEGNYQLLRPHLVTGQEDAITLRSTN